MEGRYTPAAAKLAALLAPELPSRSAERICFSAGVLPHSRAAQDRIVAALGERWEKLREGAEEDLVEELEIPTTARTIAVAVDRISLPMAETRAATPEDVEAGVKDPIAVNYRMAFVGSATLYNEKGEPAATIRHAHIAEGGAASMEASLRRDVAVLLRRRSDLRVVTVADGAPEMQNILDRATEGVVVTAQLVDFYHCVEHLAAAIGATGRHVPDLLAEWKGTSSRRTTQSSRSSSASAGGRGTTHPTRSHLVSRAPSPTSPTTRTASDTAPPATPRLPIGAGTVEATGKTFVQVRMKRAGARWRATGAQAIMGLRAVATSSGDRWDATMARVLESYTKPVRAPGRARTRKQP